MGLWVFTEECGPVYCFSLKPMQPTVNPLDLAMHPSKIPSGMQMADEWSLVLAHGRNPASSVIIGMLTGLWAADIWCLSICISP